MREKQRERELEHHRWTDDLTWSRRFYRLWANIDRPIGNKENRIGEGEKVYELFCYRHTGIWNRKQCVVFINHVRSIRHRTQ